LIAESPALLYSSPALPHLHVVTITPFFPSVNDRANGCFVAEPLTCIASHGVRNTVIAVSRFYRTALLPAPEVPSHCVEYSCIPGNAGLASAGHFLFRKLRHAVRELHRRQRIDLIHAHSALPCGHAAEKLHRILNIPFVVTVHGLDAFSTKQAKWAFGRWCERRSAIVFRKAARVLCISRRVQEQVRAGCPDARTTVIHNGVDARLFSPPLTPATGSTILCVGNLIPTKGQDVLLRAFAESRTKVTGSTLQFIGEGPEEPRLRQLAHQLGIADAVTFDGRRSRESVAEAMRNCTILALPSSYEGLGCVYLEAMACAKPVIGCRGQGIEDIIDHQRNGYLIRPDDQAALSETVTRLLLHRPLREEIGLRARDTVLRRHTLEHQAALMVQAYRESAK